MDQKGVKMNYLVIIQVSRIILHYKPFSNLFLNISNGSGLQTQLL
jgi:hypothetical protein